MLLLRSFPATAGWHPEVLATDLSTKALTKAQAAVWSGAKAREIPPPLLREFMLRGVRSQEGSIAASPALRAAVTFARVNLNEDRLAVSGPFDLILCRNVLIYFRHDRRRAVVERLLQHLAPGGYLLLGHAESLASMADCVRSVGPIVYARVGGGGTAPAGRLRRES
jgi:chemotaxis protein methyltransferase CheR